MENALLDKNDQFAVTTGDNASSADNGTWAHLRHDAMQSRAVQAVFGVIYCAIFALGMPGNLLVCYTVCRNRAMRTVTNLFVSALAVADVLLCALCVPFTPLYTFLGDWAFGGLLCRAVAFAQCFSVYVTALTLTAIAVDRFYVIVHPFRPRLRPAACLAVEAGVAAFSALATLPYGVYVAVQEVEGVRVCAEAWPSAAGRRAFGSATLLLQFAAPLAAIACCYGRIACRLARRRPGARSADDRDRRRKRRTNRLLVAMVVVFAACWLPLNAVNAVADFDEEAERWRYFNLCFFAAHALAMSSVCYNPLLYAWLNDNFRKELRQLAPCWRAADARPPAATSTAGQSAQTLLQPSASATASACLGQHLPDVVAAEADADPEAAAPSSVVAVYTVADDQIHLSGVSSGGTDEVSCS